MVFNNISKFFNFDQYEHLLVIKILGWEKPNMLFK